MRRVRQLHVWLGVFFAPAILFFACSGALMTLGLHKSRNGSEVIPVIARMAEIHRKQSAFPSAPKASSERASSEKSSSEKSQTEKTPTEKSAGEKQKDESATGSKAAADASSRTLVRAFVVLMATGIVVTTVLGLVMAYAQSRQRSRLAWAFAIGLGLPVVLLLL